MSGFASVRHPRESGDPATLFFKGDKALDPRFRGDDELFFRKWL